MYPVTIVGKIIASFVFIWGITLIALPVAIIGSNFADIYSQERHRHNMIDSHKKKNSSKVYPVESNPLDIIEEKF